MEILVAADIIRTVALQLSFSGLGVLAGLVLIRVLAAWLTALFFSFGIFARGNLTVVVTMFCGALSVATAIFLIIDMSQPYSGLTRVSVAPIQSALVQIDR